MQLMLISVLLAAGCSLAAGVVQRGFPEAGVGGLLAGSRYEYSYRSVATVHHHVNISMQAQVSVGGAVEVEIWFGKARCLYNSYKIVWWPAWVLR